MPQKRNVAASKHLRLSTQLKPVKCIFTDLGSLRAVADSWDDRIGIPRFETSHANAQSLASGIECLVLYEDIVFDSMFLEREDYLNILVDALPDNIFGVYLDATDLHSQKDSIRARAAARVEEIVTYTPKKPAATIEDGDWQRVVEEDHFVDKYALERGMEWGEPGNETVHLVPAVFDELEREAHSENVGFKYRHLPVYATRSDCTLARALFYEELTRELRIPYSPGRNRAQILKEVFGPTNGGVPQFLVEEARRHRKFVEENRRYSAVRWKEIGPLLSHDVNIPGVAEFVLSYASSRMIPLGQAILEVRATKSAERFRGEMQALTEMMLSESGEDKKAAEARMKSIDKLVAEWADDWDHELKFKRRTITLKHLGLIGKILESAGLEKFEVPDPILWRSADVRGLIFLNEVLRS